MKLQIHYYYYFIISVCERSCDWMDGWIINQERRPVLSLELEIEIMRIEVMNPDVSVLAAAAVTAGFKQTTIQTHKRF